MARRRGPAVWADDHLDMKGVSSVARGMGNANPEAEVGMGISLSKDAPRNTQVGFTPA